MNEILTRNLYYEGKTDKDIGKAVGLTESRICQWRHKNNLPAIRREIGYRLDNKHYSKVLNPTQAQEMHKFLITLKAMSRIAKENGIKPDIGAFINEWQRQMVAISS